MSTSPPGLKRPRLPEDVAAAVSSAVAAALKDLFAEDVEKEGSPYLEGYAPEDPVLVAALASFRAVDQDQNNLIVRGAALLPPTLPRALLSVSRRSGA